MRRITLVTFLLASVLPSATHAMTEQERRDYVAHLNLIVPDNTDTPVTPSWEEWLQVPDHLPPDFDALPKQNGLPDPLKFLDGRPVKTADDWKARREEILQLYEKYDIGTIPPKPNLDKITVVSETVSDGVTPPPAPTGGFGGFGARGPAQPLPKGTISRVVTLEYGPNDQASTQVTLTIPAGDGPFPVYIGGTNAALNRGYIVCTFPNSVDQTTNLPQLYPTYDFATMGQKAFTAQMVVDYLYTLPQVDKARIAITGYSRLGKMATIAAALDTRIAAVVAGSTGVGGVVSWRQGGERNQAESIETTTRMFPLWFAPQLRFFVGREDRLPIDGNLLVAMIAPRSCLIEYGMNDEVSNTWADEQTLHSAEPVYALLGQPNHVGIMRVPGNHGADNVQMDLDWLDIQFGRSQDKWVNNFLFPWDFQQWAKNSGEKADLASFPAHQPTEDLLTGANGQTIASTADWEAKVADIRKNINWLLGDAPATIPTAGGPVDAGSTSAHAAAGVAGRGAGPGGARGGAGARSGATTNRVFGAAINVAIKTLVNRAATEMGWSGPEASLMATRVVNFGEGISGDLYYPANTPAGAKLPTAIWLHGYSYPLGYMWVYRRDPHPILALVKAGYAVLAYDQVGFGKRATEIGPFFDTSPHWSQMGRLVHDARSAIDALQQDSVVDPDRIYLYGYELGATVGLYTAALDTRVKGVVSVNGFTPMRTDTADKGTGGIARYSIERPILPRLGFFIGHEEQIPVDFSEIIAAIAPRAVVVVAPTNDRDATPADVHAALEQARKVYSLYNAPKNLMVDQPWDYARLPEYTLDWTVQSLSWVAHPTPPPAAPAPAATPTASN
jgi:dienelactone hydrolase